MFRKNNKSEFHSWKIVLQFKHFYEIMGKNKPKNDSMGTVAFQNASGLTFNQN